MADVNVYMNIPEVEGLVDKFGTFSETLSVVSKALLAASQLLKAAAFVSLGSTAALAAYIDRIQPRVDALADKMGEISNDITGAVKAYRDGDESGSDRFR